MNENYENSSSVHVLRCVRFQNYPAGWLVKVEEKGKVTVLPGVSGIPYPNEESANAVAQKKYEELENKGLNPKKVF
jgi:hypothetical protein